MKLKNLFLISIFILLTACAPISQKKDSVYQVSAYNLFSSGQYDGFVSFKELKNHGNFGIGTFDNLDGEMYAVDGKFYQIKDTGKVNLIDENVQTPYATVTFFKPNFSIGTDQAMNYDQLKAYLDTQLPNKNLFYAIKIDGKFKYLKTRSIPKQAKPYPVLAEVLKNQPLFEFQNIQGTLVGFRGPDYAQGIVVPGHHFHFLTADRTAGGHVLELDLEKVTIKIEAIKNFEMRLLDN